MSILFWLSDEKMARLRPFFPKSHGNPRVGDKRVLSGIIFSNAMAYVGLTFQGSMVGPRRSTTVGTMERYGRVCPDPGKVGGGGR